MSTAGEHSHAEDQEGAAVLDRQPDHEVWGALRRAVEELALLGDLADRVADAGPRAPQSIDYGADAAEDAEEYRRWLASARARHHHPPRVPDCPAPLELEPWPPPDAAGPSHRPWRPEDAASAWARTAEREALGSQPRVSVLVPLWRPDLALAERAVASALEQTWPAVEVCLVDDGSGDPALRAWLARLDKREPRVRTASLAENRGIAEATNAALGLATGTLVAFLDQDDELEPEALERMVEAFTRFPDCDVAYCDEDKLDHAGRRFYPLFKPAFAPELLLAYNYVCHLLVMRTSLVRHLGGLRAAFDGAQDFDLVLRATEVARRVVHVPAVLYHWRATPSSTANSADAKPTAERAGNRAVADALARRGEGAWLAPGLVPPLRIVRRPVRTSATVSVVIPIRDQPELLRACVDSLAATAGWDRLQLVVVDNGSSDPEIPVLRSQLEASFDLTWCRDDRPFNWSALSNLGVEASRGELVLLLNNDVEGRRPGWLAAMVEHALVDDVGAVGARLVYPDGSLQHFGVAIGLGGPAGHELLGLPPGRPSYFGLGEVAREVSAATGACLLLRRALYRSVGGCDEGIPVAFSDVDLCLRIRALGYRIICTPLAELVHHESITRGFAAEDAVGGPMFRRWQHLVRSGDPYFNPNLSRLRMEMALPDDREEDVWKDALLRLERS